MQAVLVNLTVCVCVCVCVCLFVGLAGPDGKFIPSVCMHVCVRCIYVSVCFISLVNIQLVEIYHD